MGYKKDERDFFHELAQNYYTDGTDKYAHNPCVNDLIDILKIGDESGYDYRGFLKVLIEDKTEVKPWITITSIMQRYRKKEKKHLKDRKFASAIFKLLSRRGFGRIERRKEKNDIFRFTLFDSQLKKLWAKVKEYERDPYSNSKLLTFNETPVFLLSAIRKRKITPQERTDSIKKQSTKHVDEILQLAEKLGLKTVLIENVILVFKDKITKSDVESLKTKLDIKDLK